MFIVFEIFLHRKWKLKAENFLEFIHCGKWNSNLIKKIDDDKKDSLVIVNPDKIIPQD